MELRLMQEHARRTQGLNGSKALQWPRLLVMRCRRKNKEEVVCFEGANSTVFSSPPEWLSVPCRSLHVQRLLGSPCLKVASWRVTVTIRTGCSRGAWYSRLSRETRRSPLTVPAILTVAGSSWLTCGQKLILGYDIHQSIHPSIYPSIFNCCFFLYFTYTYTTPWTSGQFVEGPHRKTAAF